MPMLRKQIFDFISFSRNYFLGSALGSLYKSPGLISFTSQYFHSPRTPGHKHGNLSGLSRLKHQARQLDVKLTFQVGGADSPDPLNTLQSHWPGVWVHPHPQHPPHKSASQAKAHFPGTFCILFLGKVEFQRTGLSLKANPSVLAKYLDFMESYFWQEAADFMSRLIFPYFISSSGTDIFFFFLILECNSPGIVARFPSVERELVEFTNHELNEFSGFSLKQSYFFFLLILYLLLMCIRDRISRSRSIR